MGIEDTNEVLVTCDGCRLRAADGGGQSLRFFDRRNASTYLRDVGWTQDGDNWYCPACRPKLTLPKPWVAIPLETSGGDPNRCLKSIRIPDGLAIVTPVTMWCFGVAPASLPVLLACEVSAAAVRIAYDAIARPADFNRGEILALLAQAKKAAEPEVTP